MHFGLASLSTCVNFARQPPHFVPGDSVKDSFFFTTHDTDEKVEKMSLGVVNTPFHAFVSPFILQTR